MQRTETSIPAGSDLSAKQFFMMTVNSSGQLALTAVGAAADCVLQDKPAAAGRAGLVVTRGRTRGIAGAAFAKGATLTADSSGRFVTATTNDIVNGRALYGSAGAAGDILDVEFEPTGAKNVS